MAMCGTGSPVLWGSMLAVVLAAQCSLMGLRCETVNSSIRVSAAPPQHHGHLGRTVATPYISDGRPACQDSA